MARSPLLMFGLSIQGLPPDECRLLLFTQLPPNDFQKGRAEDDVDPGVNDGVE